MAEPTAPVSTKKKKRRRRSSETMRRCPSCGESYPLDFLVCPKDASPLELQTAGDADPMLGEVLAGAFCITNLLGSGGMGRVYEAHHVRLPKRYAVKVMHERLAHHAEAMGRFEREAQAVAKIANDYVLDVVDVVRAKDQRPCIVSELLTGEDLGELLDRERKLPIGMAITLARQVCRGLAAAHAAGVVHRDLKPSNLFLLDRDDGSLHIKILDFGVAKVMDGANLTRTGMVVGTPAYMAPEQAAGASEVDERADVYAVGALLYRMLTGKAPFPENDDPSKTLLRLVSQDPPRPRSIDSAIPAGVESVIQQAMARSPKDRPASARELDRLLAAFDDARHDSGRYATGPTSSKRGSLASIETITAVLPSPSDAEELTRRARRARPVALTLSIVVSLLGGAAVLVAATVGLRLVNHPQVEAHRPTLVIGLAALLACLSLLGSLRVLFARWRSVPAVERLGDALGSTLKWLFGSLGVIALAYRGLLAFGPPPPAAWTAHIEAAILLVPTLLACVALVVGLRRAARVS
jgi:serine/threonine protein kinase